VALLLSLAAVSVAAPADNPFDSHVKALGVGDALPPTQFIGQDGKPTTMRALRGRLVVLGFIYTRCSDACPLISAKFAQLRRLLGSGPFALAEITFDPQHDTPAVMRGYARKYGADAGRWSMLSGQPSAVLAFDRAAGLSAIADAKGDILHNNRLLIVAANGSIADVIDDASWTPEDVAADARHLASLKSSPLARLDLALSKAVAKVCGGLANGRSGLPDLVAVLGVLAATGLSLYWLHRRVFAANP